MNGPYVYTPQIWPSFLTVLLLITLSIHSGRRLSIPGALPFTIGCLFAALWAAGSIMEYAAVDVATKILWVKFQGLFQLPTAIAGTCFILEYAWPGRWLGRRSLVLLCLPALLVLVLILTNDLHYLVWSGFVFDGSIQPRVSPGGWLAVAYGYGLTLVNIIVLAWLFLRSPQQRWPTVVMLTGVVGAGALYLLEKTYILQADLPLDVLGIAFEFLMYAIALFGFRILDPISLARKTAIEQLHAGMLVLDRQGRIISLNPAAQAILGSPAKCLLGHPIEEVPPARAERAGYLQAVKAGQGEISLGAGPETQYYELEASSLDDWRGLEVGRLLLLHDVTGQKQAQVQLLQQQRALAMMQERERLARELHDSLGQVLGYAGFQVEAAAKLSREGQGAATAEQLDRLARVVRAAHADVRECILDLHAAPTPQQPFFAALRHYLEGFTDNYGIQTLLSVDERLGDEPFPPEARMQVFRIMQEALSNARKHGQAHCVRVTFAAEDHLTCMSVQDDGDGFDPTQAAGDGHFGLRFMQERAEALGARLQVGSSPGAGTRVVLEVPVRTVNSEQ